MSNQQYQKSRKYTSRKKLNRIKSQKIPDLSVQTNLNQKQFQNVQDINIQTPYQNNPKFQQPNSYNQKQPPGGSEKKFINNKQDVETNYNNKPVENFIQSDPLNDLRTPYQFLANGTVSFLTIIFPHSTWKSFTFVISLAMFGLFITLIAKSYTLDQNSVTWSCTLFHLQNKFFPRLRYNYQFWRVFVSSFFHSNISHIVLNLIGIQMYGYFVQWYYGRLRYLLTLLISIIFSHFLSCLTNEISVSTTSSGILYTFLGMKLLFFIKYKDFKLMDNCRYPLYGLYILIMGINVVILFVGSNVDYGSYIGGYLTGVFCGLAFYPFENQTRCTRAIKVISLLTILLGCGGLVAERFTVNKQFYLELNSAINMLC